MKSQTNEIFFDWNDDAGEGFPGKIELNDETLRDGIQDSTINQPGISAKIKIVSAINDLGIETACIGFPASGPAMITELEEMIRYIINNRLSLKVACAARSLEQDIEPIITLSQKFGIDIDAMVFVGSSPIRQYVEGWDLEYILNMVKRSVSFATRHNISVCFITEDTTRSRPYHLEKIYETAVENNAYRICLCDTVGYATPTGTKKLVKFIRSRVDKINPDILIDWHGHNDRGMALANALAAINAGVNRVHATGLGIGERTGNTAMEQLLINMKLMGLRDVNGTQLASYCKIVAKACGVKIPDNFPLVGSNAFTTTSGIHAAAVIKALNLGGKWLADRVYSSVPARELGFEQKIEIGPMSGKANIKYFLGKKNINDNDLLEDIYREVKRKGRSLIKRELDALFNKYHYSLK